MPTYLIPLHLSTGPSLPYGIGASSLATSPDGNGVILFGGLGGQTIDFLDSILELRSDGQGWVGSWTTLTAKLQTPRYSHVVTPVFMEKDTCELNV